MSSIKHDADFLETIQGLKGEELSSAVLGYLISRSPSCYRSFLKTLDLSPAPGFDRPKEVTSEWVTSWKKDKSGDASGGRLDLLIDTGARLIGVENKIWASFMTDQPLKYCASLINESRSESRDVYEGPMLVVLVPAAKAKSAKQALKPIQQDQSFASIEQKVIHWSELLECLGQANHESSEVRHTYKELMKYVEKKIWFAEPFAEVLVKLYSSDYIWNECQRSLVSYLWYIFPSPGRRLSCSDRWLGYTFFSDRDDVWGWFGFVKTKSELLGHETSSAQRSVEFVINYGCDDGEPALRDTNFTSIDFSKKNWHYRTGWLVETKEGWDTFLKWSKILTPAIEAIGQAKE